MDIPILAAIISSFSKKKEEKVKPINLFLKNDDDTIIVGEQIENWEDKYISEECIINKSEGVYAWKYTKK